MTPFQTRLTALARRLGAEPGDLDDGHARWAVYLEAVGRAEEWPVVPDLIADQPDLPLAAAVVVRALEVLPEARRADFVAALPEGPSREYAATRARELVVLELLAAGSGPEFDTRWTNWLQLRVAHHDQRGEDARSAEHERRHQTHPERGGAATASCPRSRFLNPRPADPIRIT
ncbi:hypothetical protein AB0K15_30200 [Amycolatopsis sp. NPDC049253]|uniref:hypothetical protein n=1 Tax=Amycolatopsis sp. NPDC049253 TaxID=3155274 RepID=UPI0034390A47